MAAIHLPHTDTPPVNPKKDGDSHDRCVVDGCVEVDTNYRFGGKDGRGEEYQNWALYNADPRNGGCGASWSRTTRTGQERDASRGVKSRWLTQSALVGRVTSVPSEAYRRGWDAVDWSK